MRWTRPSQSADDVCQVQRFSIWISNRDVENVFDRFFGADFRFANFLLHIFIISDDPRHWLVVVMVVCVVGVAERC